jgi:hypothetical protein
MKRMMKASVATILMATASFAANAKQVSYEMVVLHAEGAALKRGAVIDGNQSLALKAGAKVTLVGADGKTLTVQGPSTGKPADLAGSGPAGAKSSKKVVAILGALLSNEERSTRALGVVRSANPTGPAKLPNEWAVNAEQSGIKCVGGDAVQLWRADSTQSANLQIRKAHSARTAKTEWPAGQEFLSVSSKVFQDGQNYVVSVNGRSSEMKINVMPAGLSNPTEQAAWMARSNCRDQALAMVDRIR